MKKTKLKHMQKIEHLYKTCMEWHEGFETAWQARNVEKKLG